MAKLIFEDEDVENRANMEHSATHQNGTHAPVEADNTDVPFCAVLWCHWRGV